MADAVLEPGGTALAGVPFIVFTVRVLGVNMGQQNISINMF